MSFHRGPFIQRGRGLGSILSSLYQKVSPIFSLLGKQIAASPITKQALSSAKQAAIDASLSLASDALVGENLKTSFKKNIKKAGKTVSESLRTKAPNKRKLDKRQVKLPSIIPKKKRKIDGRRKKTSIFD